MTQKNRWKKWLKKKKDNDNWYRNETQLNSYKICHLSKFVKIGNYNVLCGKTSDNNIDSLIASVDVFFGLCDTYDRYLNVSLLRVSYLRNFMPIFEVRKIADIGKNGVCNTWQNLVVLPIDDMGTKEAYVDIIESLIRKGIKVGFGCVGGHGRTGWMLGMLIHRIEGIPKGEKLIEEVRQRLCKDCVESKEQVESLGGKYVARNIYRYTLDVDTFGNDSMQ